MAVAEETVQTAAVAAERAGLTCQESLCPQRSAVSPGKKKKRDSTEQTVGLSEHFESQ